MLVVIVAMVLLLCADESSVSDTRLLLPFYQVCGMVSVRARVVTRVCCDSGIKGYYKGRSLVASLDDQQGRH